MFDLRCAICVLAMIGTGAADAATLVVNPGESIQATVSRAREGDTVLVMPGRYRETVFIDKDRIQLRGVIKEGQWPVLDGEGTLNDGVLASGHGVVIENLWVRRYKGNGIMTQGSNNYQIIHNVVEGPCFYAIFPQFGKNGLVAHNFVTKSEDAAIYVGMSDGVDIISNEASQSIIGIETENSRNSLIEGNYVHDNVMGIALTMLPGLPVKVAEKSVIRRNFVVSNNIANFAPRGAITAGAPPGVGILVLGADDTSIEDNLIRDNQSAGILIADTGFFVSTPDERMDPYPDGTRVLRNDFIDNGVSPHDPVKGMLDAAGHKGGVDVLATGKGHDNCIARRASLQALGVNRFADCPEDASTADFKTARPAQPVEAPAYTAEQKGRMTYLAVCTGCHTYNSRLTGPPMVTVKALYGKNAKALADWIAKPTRKRQDYPEMPPQNYLPADLRLAVAQYILNDLSN